jgi:hypothetical protein
MAGIPISLNKTYGCPDLGAVQLSGDGSNHRSHQLTGRRRARDLTHFANRKLTHGSMSVIHQPFKHSSQGVAANDIRGRAALFASQEFFC